MKIIDLLNKIANGEEVPKKVRFAGVIFEYDEDYQMYSEDENKNICDYAFLNDKVEILEEEKKIPEKLETYKENNEIFLENFCYKYMPIHKDSLSFNEQVIVDKLNEVLDYLKSKGE